MIELLIETLAELLLEGAIAGSKATKGNRWWHRFLLGVVTVFFLGVSVMMFYLSFAVSAPFLVRLLLFAVGAGCIGFLGHLFWQVAKQKRLSDEE